MNIKANINFPIKNELPSSYANRVGLYYAKRYHKTKKKEYGQYLTPIEIAKFMSSKFIKSKKNIFILDPGIGAGILTCSFSVASNKEKLSFLA